MSSTRKKKSVVKKPQPREYVWEIIRLKGTPAAYVGRVETSDDNPENALKEAIERFGITESWEQQRLVARPVK